MIAGMRKTQPTLSMSASEMLLAYIQIQVCLQSLGFQP